GVDRLPQPPGAVDRALFGYLYAKLEAERVVTESGLPWTNLRATQFYDLMFLFARALARLPVTLVPAGLRFQPIDTDEVAARLTQAPLGPPAGRVADLGGPRVVELTELVRGYVQAARLRRVLLPVPLPGKAAAAVRVGAMLASENAQPATPRQRVTWERF